MSLSRLFRITLRIWKRIDFALKATILNRVNQIELFDRLLPRYLADTSSHIEWDLEVLHTPHETKGMSSASHNPYLSRKMRYSNLRSEFPNPFKSDIAFVIQGPIIAENDLTLRIVCFYLEKYPDSTIILSTWVDTPTETLEPFVTLSRSEKLKIQLNHDPEKPGVFNVNRQIVSTLAALRTIENKIGFTIKTRTDQILTDPRLMCSLKLLLESTVDECTNNAKIVVSSMNSFAFRLYGASDMFQFGKTKDLITYWEQPLDNRPSEELTKMSANLLLEAKKRVAEVYLNTNYFKSLEDKDPSFTFPESLEFLAKRFVVADASSIGHRWLKNTNLSGRWRVAYFPHKFYEVSHLDWISMRNFPDSWLHFNQLIESEEFYND